MTKSTVSIATLVLGQVLLATARRVEGDKMQLEFAEIIQNPNQSTNVLAALNADDERFKANKQGARRHYLSASAAMGKQYFGIDMSKLPEDGSSIELNILNPKLNGKSLRIQVTEGFKGTDYQMENQEKTAKQYTNSEGVKKYFIKDGKLIFSNTTLVDVEPKHKIITSDSQVTWEEFVATTSQPVHTEESLNGN